ncbi:hypothetical protein AGDE_08686 [Angomonas deanei]|nr:hypothetical protein AGDE_08686 [Angomonas deanei]|eukprot:EPY32447.1 hypothetical protein AGDE_08686 [Angomonas deanei]
MNSSRGDGSTYLPLNNLSADFIASANHTNSLNNNNNNLVQSHQSSPRGAYERSPSTAVVEYSGMNNNNNSTATADLQRSIVQQQLTQAQKELRRVKEEAQETNKKLGEVTSLLNEQRMEHSSLTHRYSTVVEKLTSAEGVVKKLEDQLVQERQRHKGTKEDRDSLQADLRDLRWECDRLLKTVEELESTRGLDQREVQRLLEDRSQYIPTVEVRRLQTEVQASQEGLANRLEKSLAALRATAEESETSLFVGRSAVQSAATDLEARVARAEGTLDTLHQQVLTFHKGVSAECDDFMAALLTENKELWQHLTKLQSEHDLVTAELELKRQRGETVPLQQHQYVQRQLDAMSDRFAKAQQVIETQTILSREHEREMQALIEQNDALEAELGELRQRWESEKAGSEDKSAALTEAESALAEAARQIEQLQTTIREEREKTDATVKEVTAVHDAIQEEYEERLRKLKSDLHLATERTTQTERELEETVQAAEGLRRELGEQSEYFQAYKARVEESMSQQERTQVSEVAAVRAMLEEELAELRQQLDRASEEARTAARERDEGLTKIHMLEAAASTREEDLRDLREENSQQRQLHDVTMEKLREAQGELEHLRLNAGEGGAQSKELQKQLDRITKERDDLFQRVADVEQRGEARYAQLQKEWKSGEEMRTVLQEEIKTLRLRCTAAESALQSRDHQEQDREHLMKANLKLHEQYQAVQQENRSLAEQLSALRQRSGASELLQQQLEEFQARLRELPLLRQTADEARRDMLKAREETEEVRRRWRTGRRKSGRPDVGTRTFPRESKG